MTRAPINAGFTQRKRPRQGRSRQMQSDLLEGAARVLEQHGGDRFTTNRVAEVTGVSVGSLYQYYPNKESILLNLHERDSAHLWQGMTKVLDDKSLPARQRMMTLVQMFFKSELDASAHHHAMDKARLRASDTADFEQFEIEIIQKLSTFLAEALPERQDECVFLARLTFLIVVSSGEKMASSMSDPHFAHNAGDVIAEMICNHLRL